MPTQLLSHVRLFASLWTVAWAPLAVLGVKNFPASAGEASSIPGSERSLGEGNDNPRPYSSLENPMERGAWYVAVNQCTKNQT